MRRLAVRNNVRAPLRTTVSELLPITITRVKLDKLFGLYTYDIPSNGGELGRSPILYGENGFGKTNILKAIFHLLSPSGVSGHRTALGKIKFRRIDVFLSNNIVVSAIRREARTEGGLRFEVRNFSGTSTQLMGAWDWVADEERSKDAPVRWLSHVDPATLRVISEKTSPKERNKAIQNVLFQYIEKESNPLESEEAFLKALAENVPPIFFLDADRILSSDQVGIESASPSDFESHLFHSETAMKMERENALDNAISAASRRFSQLAVMATSQGSISMHSIYQDLLKRLASRSRRKAELIVDIIPLMTEQLSALSERYDKYAKYGLAPALNGNDLVTLLAEMRSAERSVAGEILRPYVKSLLEQANSFEKAYAVIDTLISTVNEFLYDKVIEFTVRDGMLVRNRLGEVIRPSDLSSGEQQLLLLFCQIAMANEAGGIFIIDEPEISLNIKWQRRLVDALLRLDLSKNLQFILASHSMEILTKHRESVVQLREVKNG